MVFIYYTLAVISEGKDYTEQAYLPWTVIIVVEIDISKEAGDWPDEDSLLKAAEDAVRVAWEHLGLENTTTELSLVFTNDEQIQQLNAQWRNINKPTNVLSFPAFPIEAGEQPGPMLGDIIIAFETVKREAEEENKEFSHHLTHMIVHGVLHLLGYDHEEDDEAEEMEAHERAILNRLNIADPYMLLQDNQ